MKNHNQRALIVIFVLAFLVSLVALIFISKEASAESPFTETWDKLVARSEQYIDSLGTGDLEERKYTERISLSPAQIKSLDEKITGISNSLELAKSDIELLKNKNASLEKKLASFGVATGAVSVSAPYSSDLESRVASVERVVSMMEVNIGSLYARMDEIIAPIKKILKLK